jgi:uncharacterized membrane protein (UPF0127 family)
MRTIPSALVLLCALVASGCRDAADEPVTLIRFDTATIIIETGRDTSPLTVEVADADDEHQYGLMDRDNVGAMAGMLFRYNAVQDTSGGFWMYRTRVPLDIAFIDSAGVIQRIVAMEPCKSPDSRWCDPYPAGVRYLNALEMNRGFFARHGIAPGARVNVDPGVAR